jgi:hypothetical protein
MSRRICVSKGKGSVCVAMCGCYPLQYIDAFCSPRGAPHSRQLLLCRETACRTPTACPQLQATGLAGALWYPGSRGYRVGASLHSSNSPPPTCPLLGGCATTATSTCRACVAWADHAHTAHRACICQSVMSVVCGCLGLLVRCESSDALDGWLHDGLDINHSSRPHPLSPGAVSSYYSCSVDQASLCNLQGLDRSQAKSASQNFLAVAVASGCMQHGMQSIGRLRGFKSRSTALSRFCDRCRFRSDQPAEILDAAFWTEKILHACMAGSRRPPARCTLGLPTTPLPACTTSHRIGRRP